MRRLLHKFRTLRVCVSVVSLQSLNLTLQTQLSVCHKELENLQQENQKLCQAVEDRENELQQTKEQCHLETRRIRMGAVHKYVYNQLFDKLPCPYLLSMLYK